MTTILSLKSVSFRAEGEEPPQALRLLRDICALDGLLPSAKQRLQREFETRQQVFAGQYFALVNFVKQAIRVVHVDLTSLQVYYPIYPSASLQQLLDTFSYF